MFESVPRELRRMPQWVCHRYPNKAPLSPHVGKNGEMYPASCNKTHTWGSFDAAVQTVKDGHAVGIGFEFANGICGVDIDDCVADGELSALAQEFLYTIGSYAELSPSETGIHILCKGELPGNGRKNTALGLEMYDKGRYFTVTGSPCCDENGMAYPLRDCTVALKELYEKYFANVDGEQDSNQLTPRRADPDRQLAQRQLEDMTDDKLLEIAFRSKNGHDLRQLYEGDWSTSQFPSQSEADAAFCAHLAFWFAGDAARIDRVFRASGLFRKKWDEKRGSKTYGQRTISRAIGDKQQVFTPRAAAVPPPQPPPEKIERQSPQELPEGVLQALPPELVIERDPSRYTFDDTGNAYRMRDAFYQDIKYNGADKYWMVWDGRQWKRDLTEDIKRKADDLLFEMEKYAKENPEGIGESLLKHVRRTRSSRMKKAMIEETQHLEGIPVLPGEFDKHIDLINVQNGVVDLRTGRLLPHRRELRLSMIADVEYQSEAKCPRWMQFMDEITCADKELQLYLQRMVGYCMTGSTKEQCAFFIYGNGENGKSLFLDVIFTIMNDYSKNCAPETLMLMDRGGSGARSDVARLSKTRMLTVVELNEGARLDEAIVKQMTGGNVVTARPMYGSEIDYRPEFKVMMATNYRPWIKGIDDGIWRRVVAIPITYKVPKEKKDKDLIEKLMLEKNGIFMWALAGAIGWYKEKKLPRCVVIERATEEYRREMDKMQEFVESCIEQKQGASVQASRLYMAYKAWCAENGERYPLTNQKFSTKLQDKYAFTRQKTKHCNEYLDIAFTDEGGRLSGPPTLFSR